MNIEDLTKNIDKNKLNQTLNKFSSFMTNEQMSQVKNAINNTSGSELNRQLKSVDMGKLQQIINSNPELARQLNAAGLGKDLNNVMKNK